MGIVSSWFLRSLDTFASGFVTEAIAVDGTRILVALDPSCHGLDLVVVVSETRDPQFWCAPGDLSRLD